MPVKPYIALLTGLLSYIPTAGIVIAEENNEIPDIELLEFLGSFESPDGKWVDPMEVEKMFEEENTPMTKSSLPSISDTQNVQQTKKLEEGTQ